MYAKYQSEFCDVINRQHVSKSFLDMSSNMQRMAGQDQHYLDFSMFSPIVDKHHIMDTLASLATCKYFFACTCIIVVLTESILVWAASMSSMHAPQQRQQLSSEENLPPK
jgi:hypothetical protein